MGYLDRDVRKQNLAILVVLVLAVGAVIGVVAWIRGRGGVGPGGGASRVTLVVEGAAPKGVVVTFADSSGATLLDSHAALPFRRSVRVNGGSFYQLQAQLLPSRSGKISCRIALGPVVDVHHASRAGTCIAALGYSGREGWTPS